MVAFVIWTLFGSSCVVWGILCYCMKKPVSFWTWSKPIQVRDVKQYHRAYARLLITYGIVFILCGIPLLCGQNKPIVIVSILGCVFDTIGLLLAYSYIEDTYVIEYR